MHRDEVARAWVWSSLEDLYFGFTINFQTHWPYKIFNEILALEKVLKALLLYYAGNEYENLCEKQSEEKIEKLAKGHGHKIKNMLEKSRNYLGQSALDTLESRDFDGFTGSDMIRAVESGYMESRYPTLKPIYEQFRIKDLDIYEDPLASSGVTRFVYAVNRLVLLHLKSKLDMSSVKERFMQTYGHMEEMRRFIRLAFNDTIDRYL